MKVPVLHIDRGQESAYTEGCHDSQEDTQWQVYQQADYTYPLPVVNKDDNINNEGKTEINECGENRTHWDQQPRKIYFFNNIGVCDHAIRTIQQAIAKNIPDQQPTNRKDRVGNSVAAHL